MRKKLLVLLPVAMLFRVPLRGSGPYLHDDPSDRPPGLFGGRTTLHTGPAAPSSLLLPLIPA